MPPLNPRDVGLIVLLLVAVWTDLRTQKIYNALTFPMTILGILTAMIWSPHGWDGLAGAGVALLLALPLEAFKAFRMGDVKLLMAAGALCGPGIAARAVLLSVAINLVYGLVILAAKGRLTRLWRFWRNKEAMEPTVVAYGPAIAIAVLIARLQPWP